jgi:hypothetical protein
MVLESLIKCKQIAENALEGIPAFNQTPDGRTVFFSSPNRAYKRELKRRIKNYSSAIKRLSPRKEKQWIIHKDLEW